jgi:CheY-like chemotaxis protein
LRLDDKPNPPQALRQILTDTIASLEPKPDVPSHCRAWRIYDLLFCRYVQQLSAKVVSDQLGISSRHLRREQRSALEALAYRLQETHLGGEELDRALASRSEPQRSSGTTLDAGSSLREELAWLRDSVTEEPTDLHNIMPGVLDLVKPLSDNYAAQLEVELAPNLPPLAVHPVALNQLLLNLLSVAISWTSGGSITVAAEAQEWEVVITTLGDRLRAGTSPLSESDIQSLEMANELAEFSGSRLTHEREGNVFSARLALPAFEQLPVLAIDDNADTLRLLKHYTVGTRYHFYGTRNPDDAVSLAESYRPQVIALDVMMPQVDGWQVLGRLQQHPATRDTPIIVCTILAQEELALSLGAAAFLRKPVSQKDFLAALDEQVARREPTPH